MNNNQKAYQRGVWAERLSALYLMFKGYKILERRYKTKVGEVDLIAKRQNTLIFVEVKIRSSKDEAVSSVLPHSCR